VTPAVRRLAICLSSTVVLGASFAVLAPAASADTCSFDAGTKTLTANVVSGDGVSMGPTGISVGGCQENADQVDTVNVLGTVGPEYFWLDVTFPLPAGATPEGVGLSEVEVNVDLGGGSDHIEWQPSLYDTISLSADSSGFDLNGDGDADLMPVNTESFTLRSGIGDDTFDASAGIPPGMTDVLIKDGPGNDTVIGGPENDTVYPYDGAGTFQGGGGDDTLAVQFAPGSSYGLGSYDGGAGSDTIMFAPLNVGSTAGVIADLGSGTASWGDPDSMTFTGFDNLVGTTGHDTLIGDSGDNVLVGNPGPGSGGFDLLVPGGGNDIVDATDDVAGCVDFSDASAVDVNLGAGTATGDGADTLIAVNSVFGSPSDALFLGSAGSDIVWGGAGNDTIRGRGSEDFIAGGPGNDILDGGSSSLDATAPTLLLYNLSSIIPGSPSGPTRVDLAAGTVGADGFGGQDTITGVEHVYGTDFSDVLRGDPGPDILEGLAGNDALSGGGGNDVIWGGDGSDTVDFGRATKPLTVDLRDGTATGQGVDSLSSIEIVLGGPNGDVIRGASLDERLVGRGGDDLLIGRRGADTLLGGSGADTLVGGLDKDTCGGGGGLKDSARQCEIVKGVP